MRWGTDEREIIEIRFEVQIGEGFGNLLDCFQLTTHDFWLLFFRGQIKVGHGVGLGYFKRWPQENG